MKDFILLLYSASRLLVCFSPSIWDLGFSFDCATAVNMNGLESTTTAMFEDGTAFIAAEDNVPPDSSHDDGERFPP